MFFVVLVVSLSIFSACSSTCKQCRDIPYYQQTESGNCLQTQLKMALKYYYPEKDYSFDYLDEMTGRTQGKWTWTSQAISFLLEEGLDIYYYSTTPYDDILAGGEDFLLSHYGEEDGNIMLRHTNFDALYDSIRVLNDTGRYINKKLDFGYLEQEFDKGAHLIVLIDVATLYDTRGSFSGHFTTVTGFDDEYVWFHNSAGEEDTKVEKQQYIDAWNAQGTDNDVIIVYGTIE